MSIVPINNKPVQSPEIYKSNRLIESSYQLTIPQHRLLVLAMKRLKSIILDKNTNVEEVENAIKQSNFDKIFIDVVDYRKAFNIKSNKVYKDLENVATTLYEEEILYFNENDNFTRKRWIITCEYDKNKKGIWFQFHPDLIRDLMVFKSHFTKLFSEDFAHKLKNKHSFRIYELCKQYLLIGYREFYLEDFKFKLRILGNEYKSYSSFRTYVVDKAIEEINKYTDIYLDCTESEKDKKTNKIIKIKFTIDGQRPSSKQDGNNGNESSADDGKPNAMIIGDDINIVSKLSETIGILLSAQEADIVLSKALEGIDEYKLSVGVIDYIKEKKVVCDNYIKYNTRKEINYIGVLIKALQCNWKVNAKDVTNLKFTDYEQREYDFNSLERKLLGWDDDDSQQ